MKSNIPWSVKGIDPEAREAAKVAARRAGMTLGEWLNSLILQSGELPAGFAEQLGQLADEEDDNDDIGETASGGSAGPVDELQDRLEALSRRLDPSDRQALAVSGIDESIERLASTIESSRRLLASGENAQKAISDLAHRVDRIHGRLEELATQHRTGIEPKTLMALERAIAGVATHIEKSDRRNTELVQSVEDALGQLGSRVDGAESIATEAVGRIDIALDRLTGRLDADENEQRRNAARMNERLSQIDERLAHAGVERETTPSMVERRLAGFEAKLQSVQTRMEVAANARPNLPLDVMTRMEFEDWSRRVAGDQSADASSLKRSIAAIEARLTGLTDRIDRTRQDNEALLRAAEAKTQSAIDDGLARAGARESQAGEMLGELRSSVDEIAQRFERSSHTTTETMSALEGVLRSLTRRLDVLEGKPGRLSEPAPPAPIPSVAPTEPVMPAAAAVTTSDLPKRPSWSWGVARQSGDEEAGQPAARGETPAIHAAAQAEQAAQPDRRSRGPDAVFETIEPDAATEETPESVDAEPSDEDEAETVSWSADVIEITTNSGATTEGAGVDLSNLVFNLKGVRDDDSEREDESTEDSWRDAPSGEAPSTPPETAESGEPAEATGAWLDQARRAARAAGPGERTSDFDIEDEERTPTRALLIIAAVVVGLIVIAGLGWMFGRPWLSKSNLNSAVAPTHVQSSATAPTQKENASPRADNALPSGSTTEQSGASTSSAPAESGYAPPSENDIGPALPNDEGADQQPASGATTAKPPSSADNVATPQTVAGPAAAIDALKSAADHGNAKAQYSLALAYKNGIGVSADGAKALTLMKQAADQNLAIAQRILGVWYEQGDGVDKDIKQAREWYEKAGNNGDVQAMHNLGFFNAEGMGGLKRDGEAAERWFKGAAEKGLVASQVNLAIIYSQSASYGLQNQNDQAYFWSAVAAKRDPTDQDAPRMRDALAGALPAATKAQLDAAVQKWTPKPVDITANGGFDSSPEAFMPADQQPTLSRAELTSVQQMLNDLGFGAGTADGRPGAQTVNAIKAFQGAYGLPKTGVANRDLLAALNAVPH